MFYGNNADTEGTDGSGADAVWSIAPLVQGTYTDISMAAYCRRVALTPRRLPDGRVFQYKPKTVAKWYQLYEKGGMEALVPRTRYDKGGTRVIPDEAEREILRLKREYPRLNATQIREKLVQEGTLAATVSVSTIQRYIKRNGLKGMENAAVKDRKAYEETYFGGMWQADTCYLPYIREDGKSRRVYLIMILDDHSRMIVGGKLYYQENAANFQKTCPSSARNYPDRLLYPGIFSLGGIAPEGCLRFSPHLLFPKYKAVQDVKAPENTNSDLTNLISALEQSLGLVAMLTKALKGNAISS